MGESRRKTAPERPEKHLVKKEETERITGADGSIITETTIGELNYKTIEMNSHSELEIKLEKHKIESLGTKINHSHKKAKKQLDPIPETLEIETVKGGVKHNQRVNEEEKNVIRAHKENLDPETKPKTANASNLQESRTDWDSSDCLESGPEECCDQSILIENMEKTIDFKRYMDQERQTINTDRVNTDKRRSNKDQSLPELLTDEEL